MKYSALLVAGGILIFTGACSDQITKLGNGTGSPLLSTAFDGARSSCQITDASLSYDDETGRLTHETTVSGAGCDNARITNSGTIWVGLNHQEYSDWGVGTYLLTRIDELEYCGPEAEFEVEATSHVSFGDTLSGSGSDTENLRLEDWCADIPEKARGGKDPLGGN